MKANKLVAIGGGTGLSILISGLKDKFDVSAIVTVGDNGGGSGILRADLNMLPPGDIRNCLLALSNAPDSLSKLLSYRFKKGGLNGQSLGNLMIAGMTEEFGSFEQAIYFLSKALNIKGNVYPVSLDPMDLVANLSNGDTIYGESEIAIFSLKRKAKINEIYLNQPCNISVDAREAIREADIVTLGPGSLYTSVICNLLVDDVRDLLKDKKIAYVSNVMTQPEETYNYTLRDHIEEIERYLGRDLDFVFANDVLPEKEVLAKYKDEGSIPVVPSKDDYDFYGDRLITGDFISVKEGYIRSASEKIAEEILKLC